MKKILIRQAGIEIAVKPVDSPALREIDKALPITSKVKVWGDEIYFDINIKAPPDGATIDVEAGDIAYWPEGKSLCIFFGKTPISIGDKPLPASKVVIIGKIDPDFEALCSVGPESKIMVC